MRESPLPPFSRLIISIYLIGAPLLLISADIFHYYHHYLIAAVVFKVALAAFTVGSFGFAYLLPDNAKYFGLAGAGLVALGAITISAMSTEILFQDLLHDKGYSFEDIREFKEVLQSTNAMRVIFLPSGFAFPLGLLSLAVGIFLTKYTPRYIAFILCAGAVLHTVARFVNTISFLLLSEGVLLIASSLSGWFMWRYKPAKSRQNSKGK
jgi:uncharacterized iron-regulated membrane protein